MSTTLMFKDRPERRRNSGSLCIVYQTQITGLTGLRKVVCVRAKGNTSDASRGVQGVRERALTIVLIVDTP
jgi:hypothetical protein